MIWDAIAPIMTSLQCDFEYIYLTHKDLDNVHQCHVTTNLNKLEQIAYIFLDMLCILSLFNLNFFW